MSGGNRFGITSPSVEDYVYRMVRPRDDVLSRMERYAEEYEIPIVGPVVGQLLYLIARASRSRRILEFGTAIGYSTSWFARAVKSNNGKVTSVELDQSMANEAMRNLKEQGLGAYVRIVNGDALKIASRLKTRFDLVFIDADKPDYPGLLEYTVPLLKKGGILLADNTLWSGAVASDNSTETTVALRTFNDKVLAHPNLDSIILPLRDGVTFAVKK